MARVLYDGLVEYEDGTPATTSQMAKDVVEFLNWSAEPEMDQRKKMGIATIVVTSALLGLSIWVKRYAHPTVFQFSWLKLGCPDTNGRLSRPENFTITLRSAVALDHAANRSIVQLAYMFGAGKSTGLCTGWCKYSSVFLKSLVALKAWLDCPQRSPQFSQVQGAGPPGPHLRYRVFIPTLSFGYLFVSGSICCTSISHP